MTVAEIKQRCCELGSGCAAFSWAVSQDAMKPGMACARKSFGDGKYTVSRGYNGYEKTGVPRPVRFQSLPFLDLSLPFLTFHCLPSTLHRLSSTRHRPSSTRHVSENLTMCWKSGRALLAFHGVF